MQTVFLMSQPDYFDISYVINPWMKGNKHKINLSKAKGQWNDFYHQLARYATVELIEPQKKLPDFIFTANCGLIRNNVFILSNFYHSERRPESVYFEKWFKERHYKVFSLPEHLFFEGGGDGIFQPSDQAILWFGYGVRSSYAVTEYLEKYFNIPVVPLKLKDPFYYHLDTCLCPLLDDYVMYYPDAFDQIAVQRIESIVPPEKRIIVSQEEVASFCCNAVLVKRGSNKNPLLLMPAVSNRLMKVLSILGYEVIVQVLSEFKKAGAGCRCLVLEMTR